jgi:hypothetical protein
MTRAALGTPLMLLVLIALSCNTAREQSSRDSMPSVSETAGAVSAIGSRDSSLSAAPQEIYIDSVASGNPLIVYGRARTFENTVQVRVRDAGGGVISEVFETSVGEMGHHNPYVARVWLTRDPGPHVTVEAFEYSAKDGSVRSLTSTRATIPAGRTRLQLMFTTDDCTHAAMFTREVPTSVAIARVLVEALVAGPTPEERSAGATAPFPAGSRVNGVVLRGGELTVDFNERLQNVGGSCAAQAIRASVTQTLLRLPGVQRVVITAAGSRDLALQP